MGPIRFLKPYRSYYKYVLLYRRSNLPGSMMMLFNKSKAPSTAMPSNLNGKVRIQKRGYSTKAKIASGQQSIKSMIQAMNVNIGQR